MLFNAVAEKSPELAPVCGGEFVPSLETGDRTVPWHVRAWRRSSARTQTRQDASRRSTTRDFSRNTSGPIAIARPGAASPPRGLTLSEYPAWRKKNLKRFKAPDFGTVTIDHPRPLPLEPLSP